MLKLGAGLLSGARGVDCFFWSSLLWLLLLTWSGGKEEGEKGFFLKSTLQKYWRQGWGQLQSQLRNYIIIVL